MSKKALKLSANQIRKIQKELRSINVAEEYTDYRISKGYLDLFLKKYSELDGEYGYIQGATLTSLFEFIRKKEPNIKEEELITKSQRLYPVIRAMLIQEKVFKLIKDVKEGKIESKIYKSRTK